MGTLSSDAVKKKSFSVELERDQLARNRVFSQLWKRVNESCGTPHAEFLYKIDHYLFTVKIEALRLGCFQIRSVLERWMLTKLTK